MGRRLIFAVTLIMAVLVLLAGAAASQAAPGALRILMVGNRLSSVDVTLRPAIAALPGVATVDTFDSSTGTPTPQSLATYDLVVATGDASYADSALWGNRLADFLDAGGAEIQFAYDNWDQLGAHPTGRFESGGYPPFIPGPNDNMLTTFGTILVPQSPLLAGVPSFSTGDNTTPTLAAGATLLARWTDGRNAIATKGRVVSVSASPDSGTLNPIFAAARLVVNAGNVLGRHRLTVAKSGRGSGRVTSSPGGINCGPTCAANYAFGTLVRLTPVTTAGSFAGWSGAGCSGTSSCTVTMDAAHTVTATFIACAVPNLKHKKLKRAKKLLKAAHCRLGKVKPKGTTSGRVKKQRPKAGMVLPVGSKVNITLG